MVNSCCYGRCQVQKTDTTVYFPYISHSSSGKLAWSFQNVFDKCSRVMNTVFSRNWTFHEHHRILGYPAPLITRNVATNSHSIRRTLSICCPARVEAQWNADSNWYKQRNFLRAALTSTAGFVLSKSKSTYILVLCKGIYPSPQM